MFVSSPSRSQLLCRHVPLCDHRPVNQQHVEKGKPSKVVAGRDETKRTEAVRKRTGGPTLRQPSKHHRACGEVMACLDRPRQSLAAGTSELQQLSPARPGDSSETLLHKRPHTTRWLDVFANVLEDVVIGRCGSSTNGFLHRFDSFFWRPVRKTAVKQNVRKDAQGPGVRLRVVRHLLQHLWGHEWRCPVHTFEFTGRQGGEPEVCQFDPILIPLTQAVIRFHVPYGPHQRGADASGQTTCL